MVFRPEKFRNLLDSREVEVCVAPANPRKNGRGQSVDAHGEDCQRRREADFGGGQSHEAEVTAHSEGGVVRVHELAEFEAPSRECAKRQDFERPK